MQELARSDLNLLIRIKGPQRGSLAMVLFHALAWLEKLFRGHKVYFLSPEAGQQVKGTKKLFLRGKVFLHMSPNSVATLRASYGHSKRPGV